MSAEAFVQDLAAINLRHTFNPYVDRCPVHDFVSAPQVRRRMLTDLVKAAERTEIESIWIGRDLGYRGGRRTGLALTDDLHIQAHTDRWGVRAERPTKGEAIGERTAAVIWKHLSLIEARLFLWNVFPLHPHEPGRPFTNRAHSSKERKIGEELLSQLILLLRPRRLICIGNDATATATRLVTREAIIQVRHPSYGGQTQFVAQIRKIYGHVPNTSGVLFDP